MCRGSTRDGPRRVQAIGDRTKHLLVREGTAQQQADAVGTGRGELRPEQSQAAQPADYT